MIIDCFPFYNEYELLNLRFAHYGPYVHHFIICVSSQTFTGKYNEYHADYEQNIVQLARKHGIGRDRYTVLDIKHEDLYSDGTTTRAWAIEKFTRNAMWYYVRDLKLDYTIALLSDADEFLNENILRTINETPELMSNSSDPVLVWLRNNYYYMNCQQENYEFPGTIIMTKEHVSQLSFQSWRELREREYDKFLHLQDGGWHFSYLNGVIAIQTKLAAFAHEEYNTPTYTNKERIEECIRTGSDLFGRPVKYKRVSIDTLPKYVQEHQLEFQGQILC